jgi:outer membrane protein insertion porin family
VSGALLLALLGLVPADPWSLEGQTVRAVAVEVAPQAIGHLDVAHLRPYVTLAPGDPLRAAEVRRVVELLHSTGEVQDVAVTARPVEGGVALHLELLPAPRLYSVAVEGDRVLSAAEAQRVSRLRAREALWSGRLEEAARDVALHLAGEGWLEARVTAAARAGREGAEAVFRVTAGPRVRVRAVHVTGVDTGRAARLRQLAEPDPGEPFRRPRAQAAAERMRRRLSGHGHWLARVEVQEAFDPREARVDLRFVVDKGPSVGVDLGGVPSRLHEAIEAVLREGALGGDALDEVAERIEDDLRAQGHRQPQVTALVQDDAGKVGRHRVVRFAVEAGPRSTVASVRPTGLPPDVAAALLTEPGLPLRDADLGTDTETLLALLRARGHTRPEVEALADEAGGPTPVEFRVRPGPRTRVSAFSVERPEAETGPGARAVELRLHVGAAFQATALAQDRARVLAAWRNAGFPEATVLPEVEFSDDGTEAAIRLRVSPGPRVRVARVVVSGLDRTREEVVRRELSFAEDDPLSFDRIVESQQRLGALGILQRVSIEELDPERSGERTLVVSAEESPVTTLAYGLGYAEDDRLRGSLEITRRNLFGMDRSLSAFARVSFRGTRFLASYREPWFLGRRQEAFVSVYREDDDRAGFDYVRWGAAFQTGKRLTESWSVIARWSVQRTKTFNVEVPCAEVDRQLCSSRVAGPSGSVVRDTRDDPLEPRRGTFVGADVQLSHRLLGGDGFLKSYVQGAAYRPVSARALLATSAKVGLAGRLGGERDAQGQRLLPLPDRFFTGGDYGLRGYPVDAVAPSGGNALVLLGVETRVDVVRRLGAAVFAEAGNVFALTSAVRLADLRSSAGIGLRYKTALGPLRVDWAFKLDRREGESPSRLHVTVGHAF